MEQLENWLWNKQRNLAILELKNFKKRWGKRNGVVLLKHALQKAESGNSKGAEEILAKFDLIHSKSPDDKVILDSIKADLKEQAINTAMRLLVKFAIAKSFAFIQSQAWHWTQTALLHIYFHHEGLFKNNKRSGKSTGYARRGFIAHWSYGSTPLLLSP